MAKLPPGPAGASRPTRPVKPAPKVPPKAAPQETPKSAPKTAPKSAPKAVARPAVKKSSLQRPSVKAALTAAKQDRRSSRQVLRQQLSQVTKINSGSPLKRTLVYSGLGSVLLLVGLVLATIFTPMMAIEKIDIVGLQRLKQDSVYASVKTLIGTPLTLVDENQIQKRLANFSLIESFTTVSLPPHTLQLNIHERQPIGIVDIGATHYLYDPAGVQIGPTDSTAKYPKVLMNGDPAHSASFREAISVLLALPTSLYPNVASIQATSVDDVRIHLRGVANQQILWGDSSNSVLKSKVLSALMANVKKNTSVVLDVSSPTAPTVRYGNF